MSNAPIVIQARNVHKVYDAGNVQVRALRGLDLTVAKGEMVAVMGPSGCGKTTLLNCLSGLDEITEGEIVVEGNAIHNLSDRQRTDYRARRMGFVFQAFNLLPVLSAVENVELPLLVAGAKAAEARRRALEVLDQVGLAEQADRRPMELSGGQQQRVAIARALVNDPALIWADEPTGNLDSETTEEIMDLLERLNRERQTTFVLVTHAPEVGRRADRIVHMRDGLIERQELTGRRALGAAGA
jgi:putative ABC transport system ATP-binding protein